MAYNFKLDENLSPSLKSVLESAGHDVKTASEQGLQGAADKKIADICKSESRCLITADHGFGQILTYPPEAYAGLIILRHPNPSLDNLRALITQIIQMLSTQSPVGRLWIAEPDIVRVRLPS